MKKFSKNLTLNITTDPNESPSLAVDNDSRYLEFKESQQHMEMDDSRFKDQEENRNKFTVVEFQEFLVDDQPEKEHTQVFQAQLQDKNHQPFIAQKRNIFKNKKDFCIDIPENNNLSEKCQIVHNKNKTINNLAAEIHERQDFKEPPAPSNKQNSNKSKSFVFPTNQSKMPNKIVNQIKKAVNLHPNSISIEQHQFKMEDLNKHFDKERQEFYKEKSKFEKELLVRDGQIQMLQKIITSKLTSHQQPKNQPSNLSNHLELEKQYEALILEKDLQVTELLEKINEINQEMEIKNHQINQLKLECVKGQSTVQTLKNQLYIYERKQVNQQITKQFFYLKNKNNQKSHTPTSRIWEEENSLCKKDELRYSGLEDLQKRLQNLKVNRMDYEDRNKIKSEIAYSQTAKNKSKGAFQLKGFLYDRNKY